MTIKIDSDDASAFSVNPHPALTTREYRLKICLGQDTSNFLPFIALDLDLAILHRAAGTTGALHGLGQLFFFGQTNPHKVFDHRHRLAAATGFHPENVHPPTMLPRGLGGLMIGQLIFRSWREIIAG